MGARRSRLVGAWLAGAWLACLASACVRNEVHALRIPVVAVHLDGAPPPKERSATLDAALCAELCGDRRAEPCALHRRSDGLHEAYCHLGGAR